MNTKISLAILAIGICVLGCAALPPIAFRLDDVQCGYQQVNSLAIIDAFLRNSVPLTIGLITAPPLNYQGNYDCHIPDILTRKASYAAAGIPLEFASHSVTHELMTTMTTDQMWYQLNASKVHIEAKFDTNVVTFLPPQNQWNADVITQAVAAGYKIWSGQCGAGQMNGGSPDGSCIVNMRTDVNPSFFAPIDGMIHAPVGADSDDARTGVYLSIDQIMEDTTLCTTDYCSIKSQMNGNIAHTSPATSWAIMMMHPQQFPNTSVIDQFYDAFLPRIKAIYSTYTIKDLVTAVSGIVPENVTAPVVSSSSTGVSSSSSSSTGGSSSSVSTSSGSSSSTGSTSSSSGSSSTRSSTGLSINSTASSSTASSLSSSTAAGDVSGSLSTATASVSVMMMASLAVAMLISNGF